MKKDEFIEKGESDYLQSLKIRYKKYKGECRGSGILIEGSDDRPIYSKLIERAVSGKKHNKDFFLFDCAGRKGVVRLWSYLHENDELVGGIVDRDYTYDEIEEEVRNDPLFYILPCYSVENLAADREVLWAILGDFGKYNGGGGISSDIIEIILDLYDQGLKLFFEKYYDIHLLGYYYRKIYSSGRRIPLPVRLGLPEKEMEIEKGKVHFPDPKIANFFKEAQIELAKLSNYNSDIETDLEDAKKKYGRAFKELDCKTEWRGKLIYAFAALFFRKMKELIEKGKAPFSEKGTISADFLLKQSGSNMEIPKGFKVFCDEFFVSKI